MSANAGVCAICENYFYPQSLITLNFAQGEGKNAAYFHTDTICLDCNTIAHHFKRNFDEAISQTNA